MQELGWRIFTMQISGVAVGVKGTGGYIPGEGSKPVQSHQGRSLPNLFEEQSGGPVWLDHSLHRGERVLEDEVKEVIGNRIMGELHFYSTGF